MVVPVRSVELLNLALVIVVVVSQVRGLLAYLHEEDSPSSGGECSLGSATETYTNESSRSFKGGVDFGRGYELQEPAVGLPIAELAEDPFRIVLRDEAVWRLDHLGNISDSTEHLERTFLSPALGRAMQTVRLWMKQAGMRCWLDGMGNLHGRIDGPHPARPALLLGSHLDTVVDGGRFDGALGIITAIAAVKVLLGQGAAADKLLRPVEIIAFSDEEGVRFQSTYLGSRAIAGAFDLTALNATDNAGRTLQDALAKAGLATEPTAIRHLAYSPSSVHAYVELHIEQGPVLEALGVPLGVVPAVAGQTRLTVSVFGEQGHAGTVPMHLRKDALSGAAILVVELNRRCGGGPQSSTTRLEGAKTGVVCTVGEVRVWPGASNVIPGKAVLSVDIRAPSDRAREGVVGWFREKVTVVCEEWGLACEVESKHSAGATQTDPGLMLRLQAAAAKAAELLQSAAVVSQGPIGGVREGREATEVPVVVSGAGHDAVAMGALTKVGMLFVRCAKGISHSPEEHVAPDDIWAGALALLVFLRDELIQKTPATG